MTTSSQFDSTDLHRINIIFIRDSVYAFLPYLYSLVTHTELPLRLVANGCDAEEREILERICMDYTQLDFMCLGDCKMLEHGIALDALLDIERSDRFSFMDSDIFATAPLALSDLMPAEDEVAICSCLPVWLDSADSVLPDSHRVMAGQYVRTERHFLGCSYFASYRKAPLRELIKKTGLSFRTYTHDQLPAGVAKILGNKGLVRSEYDTAKVINILLQQCGHTLCYREISALIHVGGASVQWSKKKSDPTGYKEKLRRLLPAPILDLINRYRLGYSAQEARDRAVFDERRTAVWNLVNEIREGPPYSPQITQSVAANGYEARLVDMYAHFAKGHWRKNFCQTESQKKNVEGV